MNVLRKKVRKSPAWVITFADLVTVILAFFVLMLSFSATDPDEYHRVSDSMASAFADDLGGVFDRVSLARLGVPLPLIESREGGVSVGVETSSDEPPGERWSGASEPLRTYLKVTATLQREIESEMVRVELSDRATVIRFTDLAFFSQGSEEMTPSFRSLLARLTTILGEAEGMIAVQGHTDDVPIATRRFRSNWELSTARAVSVLHELLKSPAIDRSRVVVEGYADSRPIAPNDSPRHRAQNRRVEIHVSTAL
jgi:chemotaxis protein MotB